jgi:hypothetical protein
MRNNTLHDPTLIKFFVSRFVGTESFVITYSNRRTKQTYSQMKKTAIF